MSQKTSPLCQLPLELFLGITEQLSPDEIILLGLSCKRLWHSLPASALRLLHADRAPDGCKFKLLRSLEFTLPNHWPCQACLIFHPRGAMELVQIKNDTSGDGHNLRASRGQNPDFHTPGADILPPSPWLCLQQPQQALAMTRKDDYKKRCLRACPSQYLGDAAMHFHKWVIGRIYFRLVMRAHIYSPLHGLSLDHLEFHWLKQNSQLRRSPPVHCFVPERVDMTPRIIENRLFLRIDHLVHVTSANIENFSLAMVELRTHGFIICNHQSRDRCPMEIYMKFMLQERITGHRNILHRPRRCPWCPTEMTISIQPDSLFTPESSFNVYLSVFRDFGAAILPSDPLWEAHTGRSTRPFDWNEHSFGHKSLSDIYESETFDVEIRRRSGGFVYSELPRQDPLLIAMGEARRRSDLYTIEK